MSVSKSASSTEAFLSPAETARLLGVSAKALRLYEDRGLVAPLRAANGWRTYGPAQIARLHQVLALKHLGLPLSRIAQLLNGRTDTLGAVLALQERALTAENARVRHALALIRAARARLDRGETLSIGDLATLTKETTMSTKASGEEMKTLMQPYVDKHFSQSDLAEIRQTGFDPVQTQKEWDGLIAEAKAMVARDEDPASPAARDLGKRWAAMVEQFTGGDPKFEAKARDVWKDAMSDPKAAPRLLLNPEIFAFIGKVHAAARR